MKTWLVTGAGRGIGAEIVKAALQAGDRVVATGRDPRKIDAAFNAGPDRLLAVALDVARDEQAAAAVTAAPAAVAARRPAWHSGAEIAQPLSDLVSGATMPPSAPTTAPARPTAPAPRGGARRAPVGPRRRTGDLVHASRRLCRARRNTGQ